MSWGPEQSPDPGTPPVPSLVTLSIGLVLGLVSMGVAIVVSLWFVAPAFPAALGAVFMVFALTFKPLRQVAEGLLAATLFGVLFIAAFAGMSS